MNFTQIYQRLEITFWTTLIVLVKDKKALQLYFPLVLSSLLALIVLAFVCQPGQGESHGYFSPASTSSPASVSGEAPNGQHNILIILVDRVDVQSPEMEGVWLGVYLPTMPQLTMLPLYPATLTDANVQDKQLKEKFYLQADGEPGQDFVQALHSKNLWWDFYVVIDESNLAELINITGGFQLSQGKINGVQAIDRLPEPEDGTAHQAILGQALIIRDLCQQASSLMQDIDPKPVFEKMSHRMVTSVRIDSFAKGWYVLRDRGFDLTCEFPTIPELAPTPVP